MLQQCERKVQLKEHSIQQAEPEEESCYHAQISGAQGLRRRNLSLNVEICL